MAIASNLGFPRVGARRELKKALEDYWSGNGHESGLLAVGKALRQQHWTLQKQSGLEHIPSNDFSLYDSVLDTLLPVYADILQRLENAGAEWVQMDEPCLVLDLTAEAPRAFASAYSQLSDATKLRLLVATYFEGLRDNVNIVLGLPVAALHVDLVRAPDQLEPLLENAPSDLMLSLGVIDGRNIWKTDLQRALTLAEQAVNKLGSDRVLIAPSCSLLHSPVDLDLEVHLRGDLREWLAFAKQKVEEVVLIARAINQGSADVREAFAANEQAMARRRESPLVHDQAVKVRAAQVTPEMLRRTSEYPVRR